MTGFHWPEWLSLAGVLTLGSIIWRGGMKLGDLERRVKAQEELASKLEVTVNTGAENSQENARTLAVLVERSETHSAMLAEVREMLKGATR